jgi:shikimate dehydrogenase
MDEVTFVNGKTRLYGIVGDPIEQVRSPEMVTYDLQRRGLNAVLIPFHVNVADFDEVVPQLLKMPNLDGLIFTIPFKARALKFAQVLGPQAKVIGAINVLGRIHSVNEVVSKASEAGDDWKGEIFDGLGCVEAFRWRGYALQAKRLMLIGLGGAGSAICAAVAAEKPASMRLFDLDATRCEAMKRLVFSVSPSTAVTIGPPISNEMDVLLNASPVGMLGDHRLPIDADSFRSDLIVFDAIVKPEITPLLSLAQSCGCSIVQGREMMRGQISKIVDYLIA